MKLFQRLLVAGAAVSMIAPIAAQASDINLDGMNNYSSSSKNSKRFTNNFSNILPTDWTFKAIKDLAEARGCNVSVPNKAISRFEAAALLNTCLENVADVTVTERNLINEFSAELATIKGRVDGLEARVNEFEAGSFSETTTLDGKAVFVIGALDAEGPTAGGGLNGTERYKAQYQYTMNLNTSFTGDDNLYVRLRTGNASGPFAEKDYGSYLSATTGYADSLKVDKIWYTFPVGDNNTVWVGPKIENYYMHGTTPSIYQPVTKQFALGGNGAAYGASTDSGFGWAYNGDNGFAISSNVVSKQNASTNGFLTNQSKTSWATQVGYTKPQYSASVIVNMKSNDWEDEYYSTASGHARSDESTNIGLRAWWRPEDSGSATPSVSLGYDTSDVGGATADQDSTTAWFAGLTWNDIFQGDDKIGVAFGQPQTREDESTVDPFAWEAYYSFKVNDSVTVTPAIFGGTDRTGDVGDDVTGAVIQTTFKF